MHIRVTDGIPARYSITDLRRDNPQVSFPADISADTLAEYDVYPLAPTPQPDHDPTAQRIAESQPEQKDGIWMQTWIITDKTSEEIASEINQWRSSTSVTPLQIRRALRTVGLLDDITSFVEAAPVEVREAWEYAIQIDRDNALIAAAAEAIGATAEDVDNLFRLAATL
jgi:hypothetical protein